MSFRPLGLKEVRDRPENLNPICLPFTSSSEEKVSRKFKPKSENLQNVRENIIILTLTSIFKSSNV